MFDLIVCKLGMDNIYAPTWGEVLENIADFFILISILSLVLCPDICQYFKSYWFKLESIDDDIYFRIGQQFRVIIGIVFVILSLYSLFLFYSRRVCVCMMLL